MTDHAADRALAHASVLRARGSALPADGVPEAAILDSWVRCSEAGLDWNQPLDVPVVADSELRQRREASEFVRRLAKAELVTLSQQIAGSNHLLVFADHDGVILDVIADNRFAMSGGDAGIAAGSCWSEATAGTNGLGTTLASGRAVAVCGLDHFYLSLGGITCTAAPVRDAAGRVVGVLDASSYVASRQRHTLALVQMAATHIENALFAHQMRAHLVLAIHPRPEFLQTLSAGLLSFDGAGQLLAVNARGRQMLQGLDATPGVAFESLFGEPFERVQARAQRHGELQLRDALGSRLAAHCRVRTRSVSSRSRAGQRARLARAVGGPAPAPVRSADAAVAHAYRIAEAALRLKLPILIQGETGTGKELLARHLHERSGRRGAFVAVSCAALPAELIEAELFGYAAGAFTGARRDGSTGLIASADGGTLLLDEVRELPLAPQAALLRFLDEPVVRPVGGAKGRRVDVQLLAATHADLDADAGEGRFRSDLLYRLNTVRVELPPLRQRSDFEAGVHELLAGIDAAACIDPEAVQALAAHAWPGNFRELRSVLTRAWLAAGGGVITAAQVRALLPAPPQGELPSALQLNAAETVRREFERCGGSVSETARRLGISRTTVYRYLATGAPRPAYAARGDATR